MSVDGLGLETTAEERAYWRHVGLNQHDTSRLLDDVARLLALVEGKPPLPSEVEAMAKLHELQADDATADMQHTRAEIHRHTAALLRRWPVQPKDGWRPIETAPRDQSRFLLAIRCGGGDMVFEAEWGENSWVYSGGIITPDSPDLLGWRPMPAPPAAEPRGETPKGDTSMDPNFAGPMPPVVSIMEGRPVEPSPPLMSRVGPAAPTPSAVQQAVDALREAPMPTFQGSYHWDWYHGPRATALSALLSETGGTK